MSGHDLEIILRILMSAFLGGIIGIQRERRDRPAGFRTHILVCIGATLFTVISLFPFEGVAYADPTRIISQIVVGIGFLGAGTIIRQGNIVFGLTTAASLWTVAGIGVAVGIGYYIPAVVVTAIVLLVLTSFKKVEQTILAAPNKNMVLNIKADKSFYERFIENMNELNVNILEMNLQALDQNKILIKAKLESTSFFSAANLSNEICKLSGIDEIEFHEK